MIHTRKFQKSQKNQYQLMPYQKIKNGNIKNVHHYKYILKRQLMCKVSTFSRLKFHLNDFNVVSAISEEMKKKNYDNAIYLMFLTFTGPLPTKKKEPKWLFV
ncbi:uncharacterized protein LOC144563808 [Carex rostrata]